MASLWLSALIFLSAEAYIWIFAAHARYVVLAPLLLVGILWRSEKQTPASLGLAVEPFLRSFRDWRMLWIFTSALFLFLGRHTLASGYVLVRGCFYFGWCAIQQMLFQSVICSPLRKALPANIAVLFAALFFAVLHWPNPILVPATFIWGALSMLLFEKCRTVFSIALLQVMWSSMLLWLAPYHLTHGFRIGPWY